MLTVKRIENLVECGSDVVTVQVSDTVAEASEQMARHHVGCLVVTNSHDQIAGILSEQDIVRKVVGPQLDPAFVMVAEVMTRNVIACSSQTELSKVEKIMAERNIRHVPIMENGRLKGMISSRDVMSQQLRHAHELLRRHGEILDGIERDHPGLTQIERDAAGRIVI